jgi:hypothetical protein
MLNNLRARIFKYCDISWKDLCNLKAWSKRSASFNSFPPENFSNPNLKVAVATDSDGEVVCMTPIETCFMVSAFLVSPNATPEEAAIAGDSIDAALAASATRAGVSKMLIVLPDHIKFQGKDFGDFRTVRVYERNFPLTVNSGGTRLHETNSLQATKYLN